MTSDPNSVGKAELTTLPKRTEGNAAVLISNDSAIKGCSSVVIRAKNRFLWAKYALPPFSGHLYLTDKTLSPEGAVK
jgi:hypothetical protein